MIPYPTKHILKNMRKAISSLEEVVGQYENAQEDRDEEPDGDDLKEEIDDQGIEAVMDVATVAQSCRHILAVATGKFINDFNLENEEPPEYEI